MVQIKEIEVVDRYYDLEIDKRHARHHDRISLGLSDVFAYYGLEINFNTTAYPIIKKRYIRILDKIRDNKKATCANHYKFDSEKLFFCETEHPELCANETTATAR